MNYHLHPNTGRNIAHLLEIGPQYPVFLGPNNDYKVSPYATRPPVYNMTAHSYFMSARSVVGLFMCWIQKVPIALTSFCLVLALFCGSEHVSADSALADQRNVIFDRYTTEDGLSHATVNAITQDQYGFIWIGTSEGLKSF